MPRSIATRHRIKVVDGYQIMAPFADGSVAWEMNPHLIEPSLARMSLLFDDVLFCLPFCWCPCMAINVSVQYDGGFLPDIILLTQCYYHRGTRLNAMKRFCIFSY